MSKRKELSKLNLLDRFLFNDAIFRNAADSTRHYWIVIWWSQEVLISMLWIVFLLFWLCRLIHLEKDFTSTRFEWNVKKIQTLICKMMRHAFFWIAMVRILKWYHWSWLSYFGIWRNRRVKLQAHAQVRRLNCFIRKSVRSGQTKKWKCSRIS